MTCSPNIYSTQKPSECIIEMAELKIARERGFVLACVACSLLLWL